MSKKGRKVYRTNSYEKKKRLKKVLRILLGIIVIAALVFVGYSIGKPIMNYLNSENDVADSAEEPWTPPVTTADLTDSDVQADDGQDASVTSVETETADKNDNSSSGFTSFILPDNALSNPSLFSELINQAKSDGYTAISVTLKAKGGKIYYKTTSPMALLDENAVVGVMPIQQISGMIKNSGLKMIAEINILEDNNRYGEYRDGSYHMLDGSTWLDTAADKGGKPWLSPFEDDTKEFVRYLTDEAAAAGFDYITVSGLTFPNFRNSDLNFLGDTVKDANRYKKLIELADIAKTAASEHNTDLFIRINAADAVYGKCEIFKPAELKDHTLLIDFNSAEITESIVYKNNEIAVNELNASDKFKAVFGIIKEQCGSDIAIIPVITESGLNHADYDSLIAEIISEGYESYSVK